MSFLFHQEAEEELHEAVDYYEAIEHGLGYNFAVEVRAAIERAVEFPKSWAPVENEVRCSLVNRFPYGVLYSEGKNGRIYILAV